MTKPPRRPAALHDESHASEEGDEPGAERASTRSSEGAIRASGPVGAQGEAQVHGPTIEAVDLDTGERWLVVDLAGKP